jgi:hypothetical protein
MDDGRRSQAIKRREREFSSLLFIRCCSVCQGLRARESCFFVLSSWQQNERYSKEIVPAALFSGEGVFHWRYVTRVHEKSGVTPKNNDPLR